MYNIEQLKMLVLSAELGSFSACARKLGKVQSAISQGIANLEIDLALQLFDRSTRKPTLTPDGQRIYQYAKAVLFQTAQLDKAVTAIVNSEESLIRLACDSAVFTNEFKQVLNRFDQKFNHTQLELITSTSTDITRNITQQKIDLGIVFTDLEFKNNVEPCFIGHLPFYAVCHPEHALVNLENVNISDLVSHKQLLQRGETGEFMQQFPQISADVWWTNSFDTLLMFIKQNIGWAYLPTHMVEAELQKDQLYKLPVVIDYKTWSIPVDIVTAKGVVMGPAMSWLYNELKTIITE
jgi:DNA-binding transcriptional LysR family regulator